jgi:hypothetical protein
MANVRLTPVIRRRELDIARVALAPIPSAQEVHLLLHQNLLSARFNSALAVLLTRQKL